MSLGAGFSPDYVTDSKADVLFDITAINEGSVLDSEVRYGTAANLSIICEDEVSVDLAVRFKNPGNQAVPSVPSAVKVTGYQVSYVRSDGRNVEGVDVPYPISGVISSGLDVGANIEVIIEVVRRQAKLEPPLSNIEQAVVLTMFAQVTIFGETVSGDRVQSNGSLQIDFADYLDSETSCPS